MVLGVDSNMLEFWLSGKYPAFPRMLKQIYYNHECQKKKTTKKKQKKNQLTKFSMDLMYMYLLELLVFEPNVQSQIIMQNLH